MNNRTSLYLSVEATRRIDLKASKDTIRLRKMGIGTTVRRSNVVEQYAMTLPKE